MRYLSVTLVAGLLSAFACKPAEVEQPGAEAPPADEKRSEAAAEPAETAGGGQPATEMPAPPEPWEVVEADALPQSAKARLMEAQKAKKTLGQNLMGELTAAIKGGDFARGVEACKTAAPKVAKTVSEQYDVEVGRTSFKVRNPDNRPRDWAAPFVEARVTEDVVLTGPDRTVAYLSPIKMSDVCLNCHGAADQIPAEVATMLAEKYPQDEATGFADGDLRGWFWVEVRP